MNYLSQITKSQRIRRSLSVINIFGLSVCVGASLLILLYVWSEFSYDSFHNGDRVYRVESRLYEGGTLTDNWATTSFGHAPVMKQEIPGIEMYARVTSQDKEQVVNYGQRQFPEVNYCYAEPNFLEIFNFPIINGESRGQLTRPGTVVISESAAHRYFDATDPLGKMLTFRTATASQEFEVTGVIADMPSNSHLRYDFLLSYSTIPVASQDIWYIHGVYTYVRLEGGKSPKDIEDGFVSISDKYKTKALEHKTWKVELIPLNNIHLTPQKTYEKEVKGSRTAVVILLVMAIVLLVIGWTNALNLTIARFLERGREFGLRKVFGASPKQIILQGVLESGIMHLVAIIIGLGWMELILPYLYSWAGYDFGSLFLRSYAFISLVGAVLLIGTLFTGLYPSFLMLKIRPAEIMRGTLLHGERGNHIRKMLIMVQFIFSFVLITGTFIVVNQINYMNSQTLQDNSNQILVMKYPSFIEDMEVRLESFKKRLKQQSGITHVTISGAIPGVEVANYFGNRPYGSDMSEAKLIQMFAVDYDYLSAYSQEMLCGRGFSEEYGDEQNKVVLNEEAVLLLGYSSPEMALGKQLKMEVLEEPLQVIGVAKNYHQQSMAMPYKPIMFFLKERVPFIATPYISVRMNEQPDTARITVVEQLYREHFPNAIFDAFFLNDFNDNQYKSDRNFGWIFAGASLLALFVACLGLWVVALFSALSRLREVGIRKVLGATKIGLFILLTRELLTLTFIASLVGVPLSAYLMNGWLSTYAFRISIPWWIYLATFTLLMLIAMITLLQQVWRTIHLKPTSVVES